MYRQFVDVLLDRISDDELEDELVRYMTRGTAEERIETRESEIRDEIEETREDIIDAFDRRGRRYNKLILLLVAIIVLDAYLLVFGLQTVGILISFLGSIILANGLVHGIYWTYGMFIMAGYGNPSRYYRMAILNDTVDGVYGVLLVVSGFGVQFYSVGF